MKPLHVPSVLQASGESGWSLGKPRPALAFPGKVPESSWKGGHLGFFTLPVLDYHL